MAKANFLITLLLITCFEISNAQQGKTLPSVSVPDLKGEQVNISKLPDGKKITVLSFWATWCVPCKKELTDMAELYDDWQKKYNVQIVAISTDDSRNVPKVKTTVDGAGWTYRVLIDANQDLKRALDFQNIPYTILVDQKGNIVYMHEGYVDGDELLLEEKIKALAENK